MRQDIRYKTQDSSIKTFALSTKALCHSVTFVLWYFGTFFTFSQLAIMS
jgi:hypothetical protein